jgi:hypothetical protein
MYPYGAQKSTLYVNWPMTVRGFMRLLAEMKPGVNQMSSHPRLRDIQE